ncbi:MAG: DctP family TRAP transporter solute-binding subunit, partial [Deltaproteobacteria bacterium]|nr:DctP family TRAP transporter solute-binding subunit [Deltaproteobacteria bacterium]
MRKLSTGFLVVFFLLSLFCGSVFAGKLKFSPERPLKMRVGLDDPAQLKYQDYVFGRVFKSVIETRTNGAIQVELFPNRALGSCKERLEMVQNGVLEATMETGTMAGFFPEYQVIYIPYLFKSEEVAWKFFDTAPSFKAIKEKMRKKTNFRILGIGQNGFRCFHNSKRPLRKPADFKGLKFRVMESPVFVKTVEAFGAKAVPIAWPEVYTSLQTGVIDGAEVPPAIVELAKLYEVQKYLTLDGHTYTEDNFVISESFFQRLPKDAQHIIEAAAQIAQVADRASDVVASKVTSMEILKKHMKIYSPSAEEKNMFKNLCQGPVVEWLKG